MARTRAWRRYKNYTKAKRKRDIDIAVSWHSNFWLNLDNILTLTPSVFFVVSIGIKGIMPTYCVDLRMSPLLSGV